MSFYDDEDTRRCTGGDRESMLVSAVMARLRLMLRAIDEGEYACTDVDLANFRSYLANLAPGGLNVEAFVDAASA